MKPELATWVKLFSCPSSLCLITGKLLSGIILYWLLSWGCPEPRITRQSSSEWSKSFRRYVACEVSLYTRQVALQTGAYPGFCRMKGPGVFLLPPWWDARPSQGYPSVKFASTHLYTWAERAGTVRGKCPARTRTRTARSVVARTNHESNRPRLPYAACELSS